MNKILFLSVLLCTLHAQEAPADFEITYHTEKPESKQKQKKRKWKEEQERLKQQEELENQPFSRLDFASDTQDILPSLTIKNRDDEPKKISFFSYPLVFTPDGISSFFNHSFNRKEYGEEFLPHNFSHVLQFIQYGQENGQSKEFTEGVIRLFHQKLKSAPYVSAPGFERFLDSSIPYLELQLAKQDVSIWTEIKDTLVDAFRAQFSFLQGDPLGFFDVVSKELDDKITARIITPDRVRATLVKFLNSGLDKVIWSPHDQQKTWESFKKIGNSLEYLHRAHVIPDHLDVNDLYWSLVERYCYFLDLVGTQLTEETCQLIKRDIAEKNVSWLLAGEQEKGITTKMERLAHAVIETEARVMAYKTGIFTEKVFAH